MVAVEGTATISGDDGGHAETQRPEPAPRLQESLLKEARSVAEEEGVALNQFINVAVAEKLPALRTEAFFGERAARGDVQAALQLLRRTGTGRSVEPGDEV